MVTPVRPLGRADLGAVLAIEAEANPLPWREGDFLPFVQAPTRTDGTGAGMPPHRPKGEAVRMAWVLADPAGSPSSGTIRGFACAMAVADEVELQSIAVERDSRGRGIGAVLLDALLEWAKDAGYRTLHLEARAGNVSALKLYRRFGFAQAGCRRGYYQDNGEDALLLTRDI